MTVMLMQTVPMNIEASMFAVITAAITFSTDWAGDIIGGFYCEFFGITEKDLSNFHKIMGFKLVTIFVAIVLVCYLLPTNSQVKELGRKLNGRGKEGEQEGLHGDNNSA